MYLRLLYAEGSVRIVLSGNVDSQSLPAFRAVVNSAVASGVSILIINCAELTSLDPGAVADLADADRRLNGNLQLTQVSDQIQKQLASHGATFRFSGRPGR